MVSNIFQVRQGFNKISEKLQTINEPDMHVPVLRQATSLESIAVPQRRNMKRTESQTSLDIPLERQITTVDPTIFSGKGYENLKIVRHHTTNFDLWSIIPENKKSPTKLKSVPENTPIVQSRPWSEVSAYDINKAEEKKFPILGPTRQQTELYFKRKSKRLQGLSIQGPVSDPETFRRFNSEYTNREEKTSENLINSKRLRSSWSNITSGSIISRKNKSHAINGENTEGIQDVRFFAELVKPLQYRLRIHEKEEKEKVLFPSKYGFHQRSHSPTFRRLLEATEKLKIIAQHETVQTLLKQNANINDKKIVVPLKNSKTDLSLEYETECEKYEKPKTPEPTARSARRQEPTFLTDKLTENTADDIVVSETTHDNASIITEEPEVEEENDDIEDDEKLDNSFKVDFKVEETHAELHLFLPKINSGNKSAKTYKSDIDDTSSKTDRSGPIILPSIKVDSIHQIKSYQSQPSKKIKKPEPLRKKKKKPVERVKSAADPDKKIRDHLNDVHTLISIEDHQSLHPSDSSCEFAQCPYHSLHKHNEVQNKS